LLEKRVEQAPLSGEPLRVAERLLLGTEDRQSIPRALAPGESPGGVLPTRWKLSSPPHRRARRPAPGRAPGFAQEPGALCPLRPATLALAQALPSRKVFSKTSCSSAGTAELLSAASRTAGIIAIMSTRFGQTRRQFPHVVQSHRSATAKGRCRSGHCVDLARAVLAHHVNRADRSALPAAVAPLEDSPPGSLEIARTPPGRSR